MRNLFLRTFLVFVLTGALSSPLNAGSPTSDPRVAHVSIAEVQRFLGKPAVYVYDVNLPEIWTKNHLPGAIHVTSPNLQRYLPADKQAIIIFYCAEPRCYASESAAAKAIRSGYTRVYVMPEGIFGWVRAGNAVERSTK